MPPEELLWRHIGLIAHDRFFKQLLFGVLPAGGKRAPLYSMKGKEVILSREQYEVDRSSITQRGASLSPEELVCQQQAAPVAIKLRCFELVVGPTS